MTSYVHEYIYIYHYIYSDFFVIYIYKLLTEIEFDVGVEGHLTYVWPLLCVNYHISYCVHIPCLIHLGWPNFVILSNVFASLNSNHIA